VKLYKAEHPDFIQRIPGLKLVFSSSETVNPAGMGGSPRSVHATITNRVGLRPLLPAKHGPKGKIRTGSH